MYRAISLETGDYLATINPITGSPFKGVGIMPDVHFDRYYRYDDLTAILKGFADEYPQLFQIESIGKSYKGRDIWLATVTNNETGPAEDKPALWADGNIHASEVSPSSACLYLLNELATKYGQDDDITRVLDTRAFYICPRVNPDGAEWALADTPKLIRSSTRPYPYDEELPAGLVEEDIDGDGRMLMMRIPDPNGPWKTHPDEPRLLVRRDPTETGSKYYRVFPEGHIQDYDGVNIQPQPKKEGLDLNRNFPAAWQQDHKQPGAGPYPASEPETRAIIDFIARHKNLTGALSFHTHSGVLIRPSNMRPDETLPPEDLRTLQTIGQKGTDLTRYPHISGYHEFRQRPDQVNSGIFIDWIYDHLGMVSWTVEIWCPQRQAGIESYKVSEWYRDHPLEDDLKMLKWSDDLLDGQGYVAWYEFDHPQLGKIELGGWNRLYAIRNPPTPFLKAEIAPFAEWLVWHLLISPRLELFETQVTPLGEDHFHVRLAVHNTGWLPTYVTKKALENRVVRGVVAEIELPEGATLINGKPRSELGQLEGRAYKGSTPGGWGFIDATDDRASVEWVVHAPEGKQVTLIARHERAGVIREPVLLE